MEEPTVPCYLCGLPVRISDALSGEDGQPCHAKCLINGIKNSEK